MISLLVPVLEGDLGPAMTALNERQRIFVVALVEYAGNATQAARSAGYADNGNGSIQVQAHRLAHDEKVQAALLEETRKRLKVATVTAAEYLVKCVGNPQLDDKERLKAAGMILDRGGMHALTEHKVSVTHTETRAEKIAALKDLAALMGKDPRELLGNLIDVTAKEMGVVDVVPKDSGVEDLI